MSIIEVEKLTRSFGNFKALKSISLKLQEKKHYVLQGASGSGKSTLLHLMGGLDRPTSGAVFFRGQNLMALSDTELAHYRNHHVGFVFQFHFLLPAMTALQNILLPCEIAGLPKKNILKQTMEHAERLGIVHCLKKFPYELSGGEQQRLNILRAISLRPPLLLCDEPTGNLDSENSQKVSALLKEMAIEVGATLVVVTHNEKMASRFHNNIFMEDGKIIDRVDQQERPW